MHENWLSMDGNICIDNEIQQQGLISLQCLLVDHFKSFDDEQDKSKMPVENKIRLIAQEMYGWNQGR